MTAVAAVRTLPTPSIAPHEHGPKSRLDAWLDTQALNLGRHARSLRRFTKDEFGSGPAAPSEAHVDAANSFIDGFRKKVEEAARWVEAATKAAKLEPTSERLALVLRRKDVVGAQVTFVEAMWAFYWEIFTQRLSPTFAERLRTVDRIGANCYEDLYVGMATARPTPRLLPFCYVASGFSPFTFRRGVPLSRLKRHPNLFPLVVIPQHRLDNVWALSSVLHEVSHNLQADLGLWDVMPKAIFSRLTREGLPRRVAVIFASWHKETMADLLALLLGGTGAVESLMDVVARSPQATTHFDAGAVHPTPVLRVPISLVLLRRLGFASKADDLTVVWRQLYPTGGRGAVPDVLLSSFEKAAELAVDTMAFTTYEQLGGKPLVDVIAFGPAQMRTIEQAAVQLAGGHDTGAIPARFMVSAARFALDHRLATPQAITDNFYKTLGRR
jgi:hypothetical protein